jgi:hypothetical protein
MSLLTSDVKVNDIVVHVQATNALGQVGLCC